MKGFISTRLSYANVMATVAVFVALGGSSYAALGLTKDSVRSIHIGKGQVKRPDIARRAIVSSKVADGSLLSKDFKRGQLPAGATGPQGPQGEPGAKGEPGAARAYARVLISLGEPHLIAQLSHNAVAVRRVSGDPVGHFCVQVQGVGTAEISPGNPQLASAPVVTAETGVASAGVGGGCDPATEVEVKILDAAGGLQDAHFSLVVP
jgi:hypothetical protein